MAEIRSSGSYRDRYIYILAGYPSVLVRQPISTVSCLAQCPRHTHSENAARSSQDAGHAGRRWALGLRSNQRINSIRFDSSELERIELVIP
jgi:hypothetical protein